MTIDDVNERVEYIRDLIERTDDEETAHAEAPPSKEEAPTVKPLKRKRGAK